VPLGYDVRDRKLIVSEPEVSTVRLIFRRYAELESVALLRAELDRLGLVSKRREGADGRLAGGQRFSRGAPYLMLQNRIYRGDIVHQGTPASTRPSSIRSFGRSSRTSLRFIGRSVHWRWARRRRACWRA
jgi:Recombinase